MSNEHPFVKKHLDEEGVKQDAFTIRLNKEERVNLEHDKKVLQQAKDSTALKQMWNVGRIVLHDDVRGKITQEILGNRNRNKRLGIVDFD